jgi:hypothetical protein
METLISGLSDGAIYGLIAMGMSITFYVTRVINFAHGQQLMVAVMIIAEGSLAHWPLACPSPPPAGPRARPDAGARPVAGPAPPSRACSSTWC